MAKCSWCGAKLDEDNFCEWCDAIDEKDGDGSLVSERLSEQRFENLDGGDFDGGPAFSDADPGL